MDGSAEGRRVASGGETEDASEVMQLAMVKRILKYESDRGGAQNTIDFKVLDSQREGGSDAGEIDGESPAKCHCPHTGKMKNVRQNTKN